MKRLRIATVVLSLALVWAAGNSFALTTDLIAGKNETVGIVSVTNNATHLVVGYLITEPGWGLVETHLYVGTTPPTKAAPGKLGNTHTGLGGATSDQFVISLASLGVGAGANLYIAAHAVVSTGGGAGGGPCPTLPTNLVTWTPVWTFKWGNVGLPSYLDITLGNAGAFNGVYDGWCVDTAHDVSSFVNYLGTLVCSYSTSASALVNIPENLDEVNWILNNLAVYYLLGCTASDVQAAIWQLLDGGTGLILPPPDPTCVAAIVADAEAHNGFVPSAGQFVGIIIDPEGDQQITIIPVRVPAARSETAWGFGAYDLPGGSWGWYFSYTVQ